MTCIVGLVDTKTVWIGGDSAAHAGCERFPRGSLEQKVFRRDAMLFGYTGPSRFGQILEYALEIPDHATGSTTFGYLIRDLMPALRRAVVEHDGVKINDPQDGWEFLLGYRGGLYSICHDLSVTPLPEYGAVGCGRMVALGSLYSTTGEYAKDRVRIALEAAAKHDIHVAEPFVWQGID